ncbi:MAG TPA: hypothetical protein PKL97_04850 [Candidatus Omnitrophota bacterium]|nr:hypothetical protein [Candidatus Omnitrophota bacterium]
MKLLTVCICFLVIFFSFPGSGLTGEDAPPSVPQEPKIIVADFNTGDKPNNLDGDFGAWDKDPNDDTQGCRLSFAEDDALGDKTGYSIRLDFDVDSPNPAYNGFWMKLNGLNATPYNTLTFYIKGDAQRGFTKRVKIELKDKAGMNSGYILTGITGQWQKISLPLKKFPRIKDWSNLNEFILVFDDINAIPKEGSILLDEVAFERQ